MFKVKDIKNPFNYKFNILKKKKDNIAHLIFGISLVLILISTLYIGFYYKYLTQEIPLWFSLPWGIARVSVKNYIFIIPILNFLSLLVSLFLANHYLQYNIKEVARFIAIVSLFCTAILSYSPLDIIKRSSANVFILGTWFDNYLIPFLTAFIISQIAVKLIIKYANKLKIVEYPSLRNEPAQILTKPTPRGGAIAFWVGLAIPCLLFLGTSQRVMGLIAGTFITTLTGYLDDRFKLGVGSRLIIFLPLAILIIILSGFVMLYIPNPFGDTVKLDSLRITFDLLNEERSIIIFAAIAAFVWFLWMANMMSWNNGIDGQFVAISSIAILAIGILSLRFKVLTYEQELSAKIAFITLGAILGLFKDTFPPQKIIWGFGATGVGLILAALSLLSGTRISTAFLVLIIPSIDTLYVIYSRIKNKKSPFKGDRNHLHHKLIDLGWSKRKIAGFYWLITILFSTLSFLSSGKTKVLMTIMISGIVLYLIIVIRRSSQTYISRDKKV